METILANLNQTAGITGSAIFASNGSCLAFQIPQPYEPIIFSEILLHVDSIAAINTSLNNSEAVKSLVIALEQGYFILRKIEEFSLVVVVNSNVNISLINVALTAAALKLIRGGSKTGMPIVSQSPSPQVLPRVPSSSLHNLRSIDPQTVNANSIMGNSELLEDRPIPPDAVGKGFVNHLVKVTSTYLGAAAIDIFREELRILGASPRTLRRGQVADLILAISNHIREPALKKEFTAVALGDKRSKK